MNCDSSVYYLRIRKHWRMFDCKVGPHLGQVSLCLCDVFRRLRPMEIFPCQTACPGNMYAAVPKTC